MHGNSLARRQVFSIIIALVTYCRGKKRGPAVAGPQDRILHSVCVHGYNIIYIDYLQ
nr:MAG TPA: hypothetical protein [Caudoviricetes sp.]